MEISRGIANSGMADGAAVARVFRRGDFVRGRQSPLKQKPLAYEEASYNTFGAKFVG
jgi:hypothetical protein